MAEPIPLRLHPGDDLRASLERALPGFGVEAAFVLAGIGSLGPAALRLAGAAEATVFESEFELLTLSGSVAVNGAHLHASVADAGGRVIGGHVAPGCIVRTTAEVLLQPLPAWRLERVPDAATGYAELLVRPRLRSRTSRPAPAPTPDRRARE